MLSHLFKKKQVSRREARWRDILANDNIKELCLKPRRVNVLGDAPSRIPNASMNNLQVGEMFPK